MLSGTARCRFAGFRSTGRLAFRVDSGTVRDERGEPIVKASVRLLEREQTGTATRWRSTVVSATTDDRGLFRLGDRPLLGNIDGIVLAGPGPGEYVVVVTAPAATPGAGPAFDGAVFSGSTRSIAGAQVIPLETGEHRTGVDIVVPRSAAGSFPVSGRLVSNVPMRAPLKVQLIPSDAVGDLITFQPTVTTADAQGRFVFTPIPSGSYRLQTWQLPEVARDVLRVIGTSMYVPQARRGQPLPPVPVEPTLFADVSHG